MAFLRRLRFKPIPAITPATSGGSSYAMALQCCRYCGAPNVISQFLPGTHPVTVAWHCTGCLMTWTEIANPCDVTPDHATGRMRCIWEERQSMAKARSRLTRH